MPLKRDFTPNFQIYICIYEPTLHVTPDNSCIECKRNKMLIMSLVNLANEGLRARCLHEDI